jgi:hypothetical protein
LGVRCPEHTKQPLQRQYSASRGWYSCKTSGEGRGTRSHKRDKEEREREEEEDEQRWGGGILEEIQKGQEGGRGHDGGCGVVDG